MAYTHIPFLQLNQFELISIETSPHISFQIDHLLSIDRRKLEQACEALSVPAFDTDEYEFLKQYHEIINKVAMALKGLEGDGNTFGTYLPTLIGPRHVLAEYSNELPTEITMCVPLAKALRDGFEQRFAPLMDVLDPESKPLYIAMITNPEFKLNFMGTSQIDPRILIKLKNMLVDEAMELQMEKDEIDESVRRKG